MYGHMLNQSITISRANGTNDYSETQYDAATEGKARVELVNKTKFAPGGTPIVIAAKIWVAPAFMADSGDKITHAGINYRVDSRLEVPDGTGRVRLVALECTEWR